MLEYLASYDQIILGNHVIEHKTFLGKYIASYYSICIYPASYIYLANIQIFYGDPRAC